MGEDGRTLVTKSSYRVLNTLYTLGSSPEPNLTVLWAAGNINMVTLGISVSVAETVILAYRLVVVFRNRHLLKKEGDNGAA